MSKIVSHGYVLLTGSTHPLANLGVVGEHRVVLYDKIGPGTHACHWCGTPVTWTRGKVVDAHRRSQRLCADHVDLNKQNNDPGNLVPSCAACNTTRTTDHRVAKRVLRKDLWRKEPKGASWYQLTLECGHQVVRRQHNGQRAWCSQCVGREEPTPPEKRVGLGADVVSAVVPEGGYKKANDVGPKRNVVKELGYTPNPNGSGYKYRYMLACGHEVERATSGRTQCACAKCAA